MIIIDKYFFSFAWEKQGCNSTTTGFGNLSLDIPKDKAVESINDIQELENGIKERQGFTEVIMMSWRKF